MEIAVSTTVTTYAADVAAAITASPGLEAAVVAAIQAAPLGRAENIEVHVASDGDWLVIRVAGVATDPAFGVGILDATPTAIDPDRKPPLVGA